MATVEQHPLETRDGLAQAAEQIPVENPATGEIVATVPDLAAEAEQAVLRLSKLNS